MITTLLLDTLLVLSILWTVLGIAYTYDRWRGGSVQGQNESPHSEVAAGKEKEQEGHCLVGKSKGLTSQVIPAVPEASLSEESAEIAPTFAAQNAESEDENAESNELEVDYTQEDIDEEEVLREEILWRDNLSQDVSPASILTRDLLRLSKWSKHDDSLDEEDESEVKTTLQSLQRHRPACPVYGRTHEANRSSSETPTSSSQGGSRRRTRRGDSITALLFCKLSSRSPFPRLLSVKHQPYSSFHLIVL